VNITFEVKQTLNFAAYGISKIAAHRWQENEEPAGGFLRNPQEVLNIRHLNIVHYTHRWCYNIHSREMFAV